MTSGLPSHSPAAPVTARRSVALKTKRFLDIVGASVALIVLSPVIASVVLAILLTQGRPVMFRQERLHGKPFAILKFRSMRAARPGEVWYQTDGRLAGYLESYAVDGILYGRDLYVATEQMGTGIGTGLYLETIQYGVRTSAVDQICLGPVLLDRPGLTAFKGTLGFSTVALPAHIAIPAPIDGFIRWRRPAVHYRLTGQSPRVTVSATGTGSDA